MCYGQEINRALRAARKQHICDWCGEKIEPKTKYWSWFGIVDGDPSQTKTHPECDDAIKDYMSEIGDSCWYVDGNQPRGGIDWESL